MDSSVLRKRKRSTPATRFEAMSPSSVNSSVPGRAIGSIFSSPCGFCSAERTKSGNAIATVVIQRQTEEICSLIWRGVPVVQWCSKRDDCCHQRRYFIDQVKDQKNPPCP